MLKPALILRSLFESVRVLMPFTSLTTPVPVNVKPSEHLVNWYWPVVLFHWSRLPVLLSFKQVSKVGSGAVTVVVKVEALLVESGSVPAWLIVAVFIIVAPAGMLGLRCNTNVKLNEDPGRIGLGSVQTMAPEAPGGGAEQDQPVSGVAEMNVVPGGNASVSTLGACEL